MFVCIESSEGGTVAIVATGHTLIQCRDLANEYLRDTWKLSDYSESEFVPPRWEVMSLRVSDDEDTPPEESAHTSHIAWVEASYDILEAKEPDKYPETKA